MIPETETPFALDINTIANKQLLDSLCSKFIISINTNENLIHACNIMSSHNQKFILRNEHNAHA